MYLIFFDADQLIVNVPQTIQNKNLGAFNGSVIISQQELEHIQEVASYLWRCILTKANLNNFEGLIRFDFAPQLSGKTNLTKWQNLPALDIGELTIGGVYEINTHSPECMAAIAALHHSSPLHSWHQPNVGERLARVMQEKVSQKIIFVPGDNPIKQVWGSYLLASLKAAGLDIVRQTPEELIKHKQVSLPIWRWGDVRFDKGPSEYPLPFQHWLLRQPLVFNTLSRQDPGDKSLLIGKGSKRWDILVGENFILSAETADQALKDQNQLVLKPINGSSGNGIVFGSLVSSQKWKQTIEKILAHQQVVYGAFEIRWLPKINLPSGEAIALDLNVAFWAQGEKLTYLYSVSRLDYWERYQGNGVLNVSQGAGFTGPIIEDN